MRRKNKVFLVGVVTWGLLAILFVGIVYYIQFACIPKTESACDSVFEPHKKQARSFKTLLHNGDVAETIRADLVPLIRTLAAGAKDEFTWKFEDALLYVESSNSAVIELVMKARLCNIQPFNFKVIGMYNLKKLNYTTETRKLVDASGNTFFRCAITGVSVEEWCSPYGDICSREEALEYYDKCQERIQSIVSEVIAARQPSGKPLTSEQKLKMIHDWLIINADYAHEKLKLHEIDREKYKFRHLWNEYGAIMDGEAVCQGYAYAFKAIVDELVRQTGIDIECEEARSSDHSWVRVKLDDIWYNIDITSDNARSRYCDDIADDFFLISDDVFAELWDGEEVYSPNLS